MLSLLACYSMYLLIPLAFLTSVGSGKGPERTRLPPLRLNLWIVAALIALFALDFAVVGQIRVYPLAVRLQTCAFDVGVIVVPIAVHKWRAQSALDLWAIADLVGLVGTLAIPGIGSHRH